MLFTHSLITPPKVNRFGWNLEHSHYIPGVAGPGRYWAQSAHVARAGKPGEILFFLSDKQRTILPISRRPNITKFEHNTSTGVSIKLQKFDFFQRPATSGRHNSAMITVQRKFITKWSLYAKSSFHFYRWNQFTVTPLVCTLNTINLPPIFWDVERRLMAPHGT